MLGGGCISGQPADGPGALADAATSAPGGDPISDGTGGDAAPERPSAGGGSSGRGALGHAADEHLGGAIDRHVALGEVELVVGHPVDRRALHVAEAPPGEVEQLV